MTLRQSALFVSTLLALGAPAFAGELDPPAAPNGTPGPEPRIAINAENTPGDAEAHFVIGRRGSYYLPRSFANLSFNSTKHGIVIEADDVTVDLQGFTLDGMDTIVFPFGVQGPQPSVTGILASGHPDNVTVRNGVIRDWTGSGVDLEFAENCTVENIDVFNCDVLGICAGENATVNRCKAVNCGTTGIDVSNGGTISDCVASDNGEDGISGFNVLIRDCVSKDNTRDGYDLNRGILRDSIAEQNGRHGIRARFICLVRDNVSHNQETGAGVFVEGTANRIEGNQIVSNETGILATGQSNVIIQNTVRNSATSFNIVLNNTVGPTITVEDPVTSVNPWANFEL
jgi:parallel beta-helix repeat protein